ncbi:MAG: ThiF family adenylyltransferase [Betaproteobacteria bacterium]
MLRKSPVSLPDRRFSRAELLLGAAALDRLASAKVAVFGLGGVGSYAVEALARAGVGCLVLVDFDDICLTNVNRQLHALRDTIGRPKVEVMAERVRLINPRAEVEARREFYSAENGEELLTSDLEYVVDAIDHVTAKLDLIKRAKGKGLPLISCMGAGNRLDPTKFIVADLSKTHTDPLARVIRQELRKAGIRTGVRVVFSTERPRPTVATEWDCRTDCICPNKDDGTWKCAMRRAIPGTVSFVPAAAGLILASVVVNDLVKDLLPRVGEGERQSPTLKAP